MGYVTCSGLIESIMSSVKRRSAGTHGRRRGCAGEAAERKRMYTHRPTVADIPRLLPSTFGWRVSRNTRIWRTRPRWLWSRSRLRWAPCWFATIRWVCRWTWNHKTPLAVNNGRSKTGKMSPWVAWRTIRINSVRPCIVLLDRKDVFDNCLGHNTSSIRHGRIERDLFMYFAFHCNRLSNSSKGENKNL